MAFIDKIADRFTRHAVDISRFDVHVQSKTLALLNELDQKIQDQLARLDPTATLYQRRRLDALSKAVKGDIQASYSEIKLDHRQDLVQLAEGVAEASADAVNQVAKVSLMNVGLPQEVLKALADDSLVQGAPAREWWSRQAGSLYQRFNDSVKEGMFRGETLGQIVGRVRGKKEFNFKDGVMERSRREAEALVRTSIQSVANGARMETFRDNPDVVKGNQALSVLDDRTTEVCRARSGMAWYLDGTPMEGTTIAFPGDPPWHFGCRTVWIPVTFSWKELAKNKDLGKDVQDEVDKIPKSTQASMDGQVADDLTYEGWLGTKPEAFQRDVLGDGKWELWKQGKLSLKDMVDQKGRPLTIVQLTARLKGQPPPPLIPPDHQLPAGDGWSSTEHVETVPLRHYTNEKAATAIEADGFNLSRNSVYGKGVYFTNADTSVYTKTTHRIDATLLPHRQLVIAQDIDTTRVLKQFGLDPTDPNLPEKMIAKGYRSLRIHMADSDEIYTVVFDPGVIRVERVIKDTPGAPPKPPAPLKPAPPEPVVPPAPPVPPVPPPLPKPAPIPRAPRKKPTPKTPDLPAGKAWTSTTVGAEWHDVAFVNAPDFVKRTIKNLPPVNNVIKITSKNGKATGAYYNPGTRTINMADYKISARTDRPRNTWRHEYGHHVDNMLNNGRAYQSSTRTWELARQADAKRLLDTAYGSGKNAARLAADTRAKSLVQQYTDIDSRQGRDAARTWARQVFSEAGLNFDEWEAMMRQMVKGQYAPTMKENLEFLAAYEHGAVTQRVLTQIGMYKAGDMGGQFADAFGASTLNKLGWGHSDAYYAAHARRQGTELFAEVFSGLAHENPMWGKLYDRFFPNFTKLVRGALENT